MGADEFQRAGLYDPDAAGAADRLALLEWLAGEGISLDELVEGDARGRLGSLVGDRIIRPGRRLTVGEVASGSGIGVERVWQIRRASGLSAPGRDEKVFTEADIELLVAFEFAVALFGEQSGFQFVRVLGSSLSRLAETVNSMFLAEVEQPLVAEGCGMLALAQANLETTRALDMVPDVMNILFREHVEEAIRRSMASRAATGRSEMGGMAIGFVDLVGFTPLSQQLDASELAVIVDDFEATAFDLVSSHEGRVVKLIGDEVMFATVEAAAACEVALGLAEAFADDSSVTPRGAVASGPVLSRGGDYYGAVVNLASRAAELAVPYEILTTGSVRDEAAAADAALRFEPAGRRILKGFADPVELFTVRTA
ncbi:MAG: adenylate/guanylate cyclase domain-containing protein [Acidimicrobiia bacterium]